VAVGFEVVMAVSTMIALMMEAVWTSETLVNFYQTLRRYNPEESFNLVKNVVLRFEGTEDFFPGDKMTGA
jgi:hypothetical protein